MRIAVLASHEGTTLQVIIDAFPSSIIAVICNNADAGALARARAAGIPPYYLSSRTHPDPDALDAAIEATLVASGTEVVVLAGYMRKIGPRTLRTFRGRLLNTHPALLRAANIPVANVREEGHRSARGPRGSGRHPGDARRPGAGG